MNWWNMIVGLDQLGGRKKEERRAMTGQALTKGDYGIDAPLFIRNLMIAAVVCLISALLVLAELLGTTIGNFIGSILLIFFLASSIAAGYMVWSSKIGKYREREKILDLASLEGNETVLDVGCGRGLLLNSAARRLSAGEAIGIDIWEKEDQSGNDPDVTRANAQAEGVADRIEIISSDMRKMPFRDKLFDIVVSNIAIHNLHSREDREAALHEIIRVLKPGGRIAISDFRNVTEYLGYLTTMGVQDIQTVGPHYSMFPPVRILTGRKS
jgi:ubiquinone/menaquinone biosynthesis C-methylase UbiE